MSESGLGNFAFPPRLPTLDALRGVASLAVMWFHFTLQPYLSNDAIRRSGKYGWLGVEVFFVVSGFVIPYTMALVVTMAIIIPAVTMFNWFVEKPSQMFSRRIPHFRISAFRISAFLLCVA